LLNLYLVVHCLGKWRYDYVRGVIFKRAFLKHGIFLCVKNVASVKYEAWKILCVQFYYHFPCICMIKMNATVFYNNESRAIEMVSFYVISIEFLSPQKCKFDWVFELKISPTLHFYSPRFVIIENCGVHFYHTNTRKMIIKLHA
jgi:hypothetical protein